MFSRAFCVCPFAWHYTAHWAVPGSGIQSQIAFVNGHVVAMILQGVKNRAARNGR